MDELVDLSLRIFSTPDVERVWGVIRAHRGRENAIPLQRIATVLDIAPRDVQQAVKYLVEEQFLPIGSGMKRPFGYYVIVRAEELDENHDHFVRRALSNLRHARAYRRNSIVAPIIGQLELELADDGDIHQPK